jgi:hypothetical protein
MWRKDDGNPALEETSAFDLDPLLLEPNAETTEILKR